ncbi:hexose kinase [Arthrobacter sp. JZ12]|uniref:1-phosphofructokinase family hexose kinase n=1 Tax=Arthrobacter sp. JZ12 TaxID=2654190 RepID=UPI002B49301E|nr:1-phosphofructokinase family hexose kinase [Arthrobacter sp. JZ12]WRH23778.1 hexose kinase [Arthrobacter sp. JZ12]
MIITLTANPSLDRTIELAAPLARGAVQRATANRQESGGKGVNVCRALSAGGADARAILPGRGDDPVLTGLDAASVPYRNLPISSALRSNVTITEPDGTTTKINEPGPALTPQEAEELVDLVVEASDGASWLVLAGSLPPGLASDFYASVVRAVRTRYAERAPMIAIDASEAALIAAIEGDAAPDLLKPNAEELSQLTGIGHGDELENQQDLAVEAATRLLAHGVRAVLATLGSKGALLVSREGAWHAQHPPITAISTVGAGDSALAGYLLAHTSGRSAPDCLRQAVAHGSAAASLPGSTVPALNQTTPEAVVVRALTPTNPAPTRP